MSIKNQASPTQPVLLEDDSISFKSCCTELFRWVRASAECVEEIPDVLKGLADDIEQAWQDSAKR